MSHIFSDIDVMVRIENINNIYLAEIQNEDIVVLKISDCEIDKDFVEKVTNCLVKNIDGGRRWISKRL